MSLRPLVRALTSHVPTLYYPTPGPSSLPRYGAVALPDGTVLSGSMTGGWDEAGEYVSVGGKHHPLADAQVSGEPYVPDEAPFPTRPPRFQVGDKVTTSRLGEPNLVRTVLHVSWAPWAYGWQVSTFGLRCNEWDFHPAESPSL